MSRRISEPLAPGLLAAVRAQLQEGERLAWAASPEPPPAERAKRGLGTWEAVAILGGGYAVLGSSAQALRTEQWWWFSVPAAVILIGAVAYFIASRIKQSARLTREGTVYGLTTRRALIVNTYPSLAVRTLSIDTITDITARDLRDDFADLCLSTAEDPAAFVFCRIPDAERTRTQLLRVIRDPQAVDQQIAAAEAYAQAMQQMRMKVTSGPR